MDVWVGASGSAPFAIQKAVLRRSSGPAPHCPAPGAVLDVPLAALAPIAVNGGAWDAPANLVFRSPGVRVRLPGTSHAAEIDVGLDANDTYRVVLLSHGVPLTAIEAAPVRGGSGLATRRLPVPDVDALTGFDVVEIRPEHGDGSYSLGHLALLP